MRDLPKHYLEFLDLATKAGLDCPHGLALYACNRRVNGGFSNAIDLCHYSPSNEEILKRALDCMKRAKIETAKRWLNHYAHGGSIKSLRTVKEELRLRRIRDARSRKYLRRDNA